MKNNKELLYLSVQHFLYYYPLDIPDYPGNYKCVGNYSINKLH